MNAQTVKAAMADVLKAAEEFGRALKDAAQKAANPPKEKRR